MEPNLSRQQVSDAVTDQGWRLVLGVVMTSVAVKSPAHAAAVAAIVTTEAGEAAGSLRMELRPDRIVIALQDAATAGVYTREIAAAHRISAALEAGGLHTSPDVDSPNARSVQLIEIGIDAMDIATVRPFWRAVLDYEDAPDNDDAVIDPQGHGPAVWFQQMDAPRPQRNRIHFDVSVPHDEAARRIAATLAAGGVLLSDAEAPAFWVLADPEGNEACVTTWQGRD
jgi:4a-hydroxytetrahydrobiopterin dehydratase